MPNHTGKILENQEFFGSVAKFPLVSWFVPQGVGVEDGISFPFVRNKGTFRHGGVMVKAEWNVFSVKENEVRV